jgi:cytochrome b subunit of formate dehydrogenase
MSGAWMLVMWLAVGPTHADCLDCHGDKDLRDERGRSLHVDQKAFEAGVHSGLGCTGCHESIKEYPHPSQATLPSCATCHEDQSKQLAQSVHGSVAGASDRPGCSSCHGSAHAVLGAASTASPVAKANLAATCGGCHANPDFLARHKIPLARPIESYRLSVHGRAVAAGNEKAASCSDCHDSHSILPARDPRAKVNHWAVARTCSACHGEIGKTYSESVHGQSSERGVRESPVCTDCHGEHAILAPSEPDSLVNPARVSAATCGRCHGDERLARKYNLPRDKVPSFEQSFHGLAARAGSLSVANCASCHGVHNILPSSDPRSTIHQANLGKTCGACHPGAGSRFAIGAVHVRSDSQSEHIVVRWIRVGYVFFIIPLTIGGMVLHNLLDFFIKLLRGVQRREGEEEVPRMNLHFRIAHLLVVVSFPTLVITGFALTFPDAWWATPLASFRGLVHRIAAVVLILSMVYHAVHLILSSRDRVILKHLWPGPKDLRDAWDLIRHNLGLKVRRPHFGKFSYAEKAEYWAFVWGSFVMAASGFMLWFNNISLRYLPKWTTDAATAVHFYEAILATLSILIWHFYIVVFDPEIYPMDRAWITGRASAEHLRHTRPAYLRFLTGERDPVSQAKPDGDAPPSTKA